MKTVLRIDGQVLIDFVGDFLLGKVISDSLPPFDIRKVFKLKNQHFLSQKKFDKSTHEKILLLQPISRLCEIPEFDGSETSKVHTDSYYNVHLKLITDLDLPKLGFRYYKGNLDFDGNNRDQLIASLIIEKENPSQNDSRYRLGFRSIWYILRNNLDKIDGQYIAEINSMLKPFYDSYRHKSILVPGISL